MNFEDIDGLVFKKASIRMTNMPLYEMLGKAAKKDQDECVFQLKNSMLLFSFLPELRPKHIQLNRLLIDSNLLTSCFTF